MWKNLSNQMNNYLSLIRIPCLKVCLDPPQDLRWTHLSQVSRLGPCCCPSDFLAPTSTKKKVRTSLEKDVENSLKSKCFTWTYKKTDIQLELSTWLNMIFYDPKFNILVWENSPRLLSYMFYMLNSWQKQHWPN